MTLASLIKPPDLTDVPIDEIERFGEVAEINIIGSGQRVVIVTPYKLHLFQPKRFSKKYVPKMSLSWLDINSITMKSSTYIKILYQKEEEEVKLKLDMEGNQKLTHSILNCFMRIQSPLTTPRVIEPIKYENTGFHIGWRMKVLADRAGIHMSQIAFDTITDFGRSQDKETTFKLDQISTIIDVMPFFFASISILPSISKLIIPCTLNTQCVEPFCEALRQNQLEQITAIDILDADAQQVVEILDAYAESNSLFNMMIFERTRMNNSAIRSLGRVCGADDAFTRKIKHLKIIDCNVHSPTLSEVMPSFTSLKTLALIRSCRNPPTFPTTLEALSLSQCNIDLHNFFLENKTTLPESAMTYLDLSGNNSVGAHLTNIFFPINLVTLDMSHVKVPGKLFSKIFSLFLSHRKALEDRPLRAVFNGIVLPEADWEIFRTSLSRCLKQPSFLTELYWDGNPVHVEFFAFIDQLCPHLTVLSLAGCITDETVDALSRYIRLNKTVTNLNICGTDTHRIKKNWKSVFSALARNATIKRVRFNGQKGGKAFLVNLNSVLDINKTIEFISIGDNEITNFKDYEQFYARLRRRRAPIEIEYPAREIAELIELGFIDASRADQLFAAGRKLKDLER